MRLHALAILAGAAIGLMLPAAAQAQTPAPPSTASAPAVKNKYTITELAKVFQDANYRAEVPADQKTPHIITGMSGYKVWVNLYSCDGDAGCGSMMFSIILSKSANKTLSIANKWNQEKRYAKAYLDTDGDLNLEYDVSFAGGVTAEHIAQTAGVFDTLLSALDQFIAKQAGN